MKKARQDIDRLLNRLFPVMLLSEFAIFIPDKYSLLQLTLLSIWGISTVSFIVLLVYYCRKHHLSLKGIFKLYTGA